MDAGLTAVSKRRKRKDDKMNSVMQIYEPYVPLCGDLCGSAASLSAQTQNTPLVKISLQWQLTKLLLVFLSM